MSNKVYITGIGVISPLGIGIKENVEAIQKTISGIKNTSDDPSFFLDNYGKAAEFNPKDFIDDKKALKVMSAATVMGCAATKLALNDAGLTKEIIQEETDENAIIFGSGIWNGSIVTLKDALLESIDNNDKIDYNFLGQQGYRNLPPLWILPRLPNTTAGQISIINQIKGLNYSVVNGPNSGIVAIGEAFLNVKMGRCKRVFAGSAERTVFADLFHCLKKRGIVTDKVTEALPFASNSRGALGGEGASVVVLENDSAKTRTERIRGEVLSYSNFYVPDIDSSSAEEISVLYQNCIKTTLDNAGIRPEQVGFILASASGYPVIDQPEAMAIRKLFKEVPVTTIHSLTGNLFAASGSVSMAFAVLQMNYSCIAPILNTQNLFFEKDINYVLNEAKCINTKYSLVNSFDFTGSACSILLKNFEDDQHDSHRAILY